MIIWLTGMPCSGKTTIAKRFIEIVDNPLATRKQCELLDGDVLRNSNFSKGIGFSKEEREQHLLRVGVLAEYLNKYVPYVLCSFVSPYEETRAKLPIDLLVHVKAKQETCIDRDVKGMWAKAQAGEIKGFTGYDAPYEEPPRPDLVLETDNKPLAVCTEELLRAVQNRHGVSIDRA